MRLDTTEKAFCLFGDLRICENGDWQGFCLEKKICLFHTNLFVPNVTLMEAMRKDAWWNNVVKPVVAENKNAYTVIQFLKIGMRQILYNVHVEEKRC